MFCGDVSQFFRVLRQLFPQLGGHQVGVRVRVSVMLLYEARLTERLVALAAVDAQRATVRVRS